MSWVKYLIAVAMVGFVIFDSPYGMWALHRVLGDGTARPGWIAVPQSALVISGTRRAPLDAALEAGTVQYTTTMFDPQLSRFYAETLSRSGFTIDDKDMRAIGMATARAMGIRRLIDARDAAHGRVLRITVRKVDSVLFGHRLVQIAWSRHAPGTLPSVKREAPSERFSTDRNSF